MKQLKFTDIKGNDKNPRYIKETQFEKLLKSILTLPKMLELRPIILDEDIAIAGNMRVKTLAHIKEKGKEWVEQELKKLGKLENLELFTPILNNIMPSKWYKRVEHFTEEEIKEFIVKDNLPFGDWDFDILSSDYDLEQLSDWGLEAIKNAIEIPDMPDTSSSIGGDGNVCPHCGKVIKP